MGAAIHGGSSLSKNSAFGHAPEPGPLNIKWPWGGHPYGHQVADCRLFKHSNWPQNGASQGPLQVARRAVPSCGSADHLQFPHAKCFDRALLSLRPRERQRLTTNTSRKDMTTWFDWPITDVSFQRTAKDRKDPKTLKVPTDRIADH